MSEHTDDAWPGSAGISQSSTSCLGVLGPSRRLRVAIATAGRFHLLDLARELAQIGHDVRLYSMLPNSRVQTFGLDPRLHRSLLPFVAPLAGLQRFAPNFLPEWRDRCLTRALDLGVGALLEQCDVFIGMSGIFVRALRVAKQKYGARVWLERGSRHIESQAEILKKVRRARGPVGDMITRELTGYRLADRIVVPSQHVFDSFSHDPIARAKLFQNPYGTSLAMFPQHPRVPREGSLRLLFVGAWSLRKGCDVLEQAICASRDLKLQHVGPIGDLPFPTGGSQFKHAESVPQPILNTFYDNCDVVVLASREEGLSVVLAQALATGLPIICTDRTGGEDLGHTGALRDRIFIVPHDDATALRTAIEQVRSRLTNGPPFPFLGEEDRRALGWEPYAVRYSDELIADWTASTPGMLAKAASPKN